MLIEDPPPQKKHGRQDDVLYFRQRNKWMEFQKPSTWSGSNQRAWYPSSTALRMLCLSSSIKMVDIAKTLASPCSPPLEISCRISINCFFLPSGSEIFPPPRTITVVCTFDDGNDDDDDDDNGMTSAMTCLIKSSWMEKLATATWIPLERDWSIKHFISDRTCGTKSW